MIIIINFFFPNNYYIKIYIKKKVKKAQQNIINKID